VSECVCVYRTENAFNAYRNTSPHLKSLYQLLYWPCTLFGSIIIPLQDLFIQSGHFSFRNRSSHALQQLGRTWAAAAVVGVVLVSVIVGTGLVGASVDAVTSVVMILSNTYGIVGVVFLLGYGLVELPRTLWKVREPL